MQIAAMRAKAGAMQHYWSLPHRDHPVTTGVDQKRNGGPSPFIGPNPPQSSLF
jgi:hypothetical protein